MKTKVQKMTAWAFLLSTAVGFSGKQTLASGLGLVAGICFFLDVIILSDK